MAADVVMPQMGESIFEGTITKWLKKPGDKVERDEPLFEISTDKVDAEIPSPTAGVLKEIKVKEGQTVPINTVVATIDGAGAAVAVPAPAPTPAATPAAKPEAPKPVAVTPPTPAAAPRPGPVAVPAPQAAPAAAASAPAREGARIHSSPLVRRMAKEHGIDLGGIPGTGAGGRITKEDIESVIAGGGGGGVPSPFAEPARAYEAPPQPSRPAAMPPPSLSPAPTAGPGGQAAHGTHVSPHVYSVDEIDMSKVAALRAKSKAEFEERYETKLTFMPFFVKAAVSGLRAFPTLNASLDGTNVVLHKEINVGIAVALDWGLIVPVVKNADEKNILGIQRTLNDLAERARSKKLRPEEVQEGTFSITNPGVFGGLFGLPVISQPNVGILGLGAIEKRPVVINDSIAIRSMCYVTLSYDHRVVDGAVAHQFLHKVKETLENWSEPLV